MIQSQAYQIHDVINACKKGERKAFKTLYDQYSDAMYAVCYRMTENKHDAEDVLQESFLSAFSKIHQYTQSSTFGAWLKRIVINTSLNFLKRKKINFIEFPEEKMRHNDDNVETYVEHDLEKIKQAIKKLPNGYKQIIILYLIEGYDHTEIAEILHISTNTSKSQYSRAKKKLIEILKNN